MTLPNAPAAPRGPRQARRLASLFAGALAAAPSAAVAQSLEPGRPLLPAYSLAGDDGAATLWRNPANLALDPDESWFLGLEIDGSPEGGAGFFGATHAGPLGAGVAWRQDEAGNDWWTLSSGLSLKLDRSLAVGGHLGWQIPDGEGNNFVSWDAGATWRPLRWLGVAVVGQNLGADQESLGVSSRWGPGLTFRPAGDRFYFSADYLLPTGPEVTVADGSVQGSLRVLPTEGLVLRAWGDQEGRVGAGLELYFGRGGAGAYGRTPLDADGTGGGPVGLAYGASAEGDQRLIGSGRKVMELTLGETYPYRPNVGLFRTTGETYLHLLDRLDRAVQDDNVRGLVLHLDRTPFSLAQVEELRTLILQARDRDKPVVAYLDRATSNSAYLLASAADKVYMHPAADLELIGLSVEMQFLRGTLDLVGVEPQVARRGKYKSSPEMFTNTGSSPANREQIQALMDDLSANWAQAIAEGRGKDVERVWELVDGGPYTASEAENHGLIDGTVYPDELSDKADDIFAKDYQLIDDYGLEDEHSGWRPRREIAVVDVTGTIVPGDSAAPGLFGGTFTAGSDTVARQLRQAGSDSAVKAVILRVDSPGGSSFASDEIWRAVEELKDKDKPVVVSMGGLAASGGYYVSAGADAILANPSTITGSIGVYAGPLLNMEELFDRIGLQTEIYTRGRNAAMWSISKPMDDVEFAAVDRLVADTYRQFKEKVEEGRQMDPEEVEEVAQGRVWSGTRAVDNGLVDELGGFQAATAKARELAEIPEDAEVHLVAYTSRPGPGNEAVRRGIQVLGRSLGLDKRELPQLPAQLAELERYHQLSGERTWTMMPYTLEIE